MSKKKYKKRHSNSTMAAKRQAVQEELADQKDRDRKRMDPTARALLLSDLVFLAIISLLANNGLISDVVSWMSTMVGVIVLLAALWVQFGPKGGGGKAPRL